MTSIPIPFLWESPWGGGGGGKYIPAALQAKIDTFDFDSNMLSSSSPEESHESPPEWLKKEI